MVQSLIFSVDTYTSIPLFTVLIRIYAIITNAKVTRVGLRWISFKTSGIVLDFINNVFSLSPSLQPLGGRRSVLMKIPQKK